MKDGVDGVVVDKPSRLVEESKKGVAALALQDRYPSGEAATSLLRQIRVARTEAVPAIVLLTGDLPQGDKLVLEKQYKVKEFIRLAENPIRIAQAVSLAAGHVAGSKNGDASLSGEDEVVLHPDEEKNAFDISVESVAQSFQPNMDDVFDDSDEPKTVEVSAAELMRLRKGTPASEGSGGAPRTVHDDEAQKSNGVDITSPGGSVAHKRGGSPRGPNPVTQEGDGDFVDLEHETSEGLVDLSRLPAPGGEADVEFLEAQSLEARPTSVSRQPSPISVLAPPQAASDTVNPSDVQLEGAAKAGLDEGEPVQTTQPQDFQKAQNELKKALIAERKQREAAQKRVEELEAKLAKVGDILPKSTTGVPAEGVFEDVRYPALLARCRADAFTGAIQMQSGGATRNVYLKDGLPVAFHSSEPGERIGKVLVTQGRITDAQYMQATTRSVERSIKLTDALVELGWMDAETIAVEQRNLARDQIIQSFELVQGRFTVATGSVPDANT
ncbi:MAG TPA: DUF4388 domain-containing protein, partial [Myxococcota bacterium]